MFYPLCRIYYFIRYVALCGVQCAARLSYISIHYHTASSMALDGWDAFYLLPPWMPVIYLLTLQNVVCDVVERKWYFYILTYDSCCNSFILYEYIHHCIAFGTRAIVLIGRGQQLTALQHTERTVMQCIISHVIGYVISSSLSSLSA